MMWWNVAITKNWLTSLIRISTSEYCFLAQFKNIINYLEYGRPSIEHFVSQICSFITLMKMKSREKLKSRISMAFPLPAKEMILSFMWRMGVEIICTRPNIFSLLLKLFNTSMQIKPKMGSMFLLFPENPATWETLWHLKMRLKSQSGKHRRQNFCKNMTTKKSWDEVWHFSNQVNEIDFWFYFKIQGF